MKIRYWALFLMLFWAAFALRLQGTAQLGLQSDEGVHLVVAEQVAAGQVIYRDLFENRTPGVEWLLAAVFRLTGGHYFVGRLLTILAGMVTIAGLIAAGKAVFSRELSNAAGLAAGAGAGLLFAVAPLPIFWSRYTMLEPWETAVATLSIVCALRGIQSAKWSHWFAAGSLVGLAILSKQSGIVLLPLHVALLGWLLLRQQPSGRTVWLWLVGFGLVLGVFTAVLLWQGALGDFLHFLSGADRLAPLANLDTKLLIFWDWIQRQPALGLAIIGAVFIIGQLKLPTAFVLAWAVVETAVLFLPPELDLDWGGFSHYVFPVVAAASLLAGCGFVQGWQAASRYKLGRAGWILLLSVLILPVLPAWAEDVDFVWRKVTYPQADLAVGRQIGQALALVSQPDQPALVFANSGFYYWANRSLASKFFHLPGFLPESDIVDEASQSWQAALQNPQTGGLLISRVYLERRVPQAVLDDLWQHWLPVKLFWYPYQNDVLLFVPRPQPSGNSPLAAFDGGVELLAVQTEQLEEAALLVKLEWMAFAPQQTDYKVFVHLLAPDGSLLTQSDSQPMAGFAPMTGWPTETAVLDWHWLELPHGLAGDEYTLNIGLYQAETGERLLLNSGSAPADAFVFSVEP